MTTLEDLPPHKQKLAQGLLGHPLDGPHSVNSYRRAWGLEPLEALPNVPTIREARGLGDVVASVIKTVTFGYVRPCGGCTDRQEYLNRMVPFSTGASKLKWAYGVTTVPSRLNNGLLEGTLTSLRKAGFDFPRLFVDGASNGFERFNLPVTYRADTIRTAGNWTLSLMELYIREPLADRYAVFQDDFVTYSGLREYLESIEYPARGYWNLYTFPHNQPEQLAVRIEDGKRTHPDLDPNQRGFYRSDQYGKGAVALVFDLNAVTTLLSSQHLVQRVKDPIRGHRCIDGGIVEALKQAGYTEYVHNPSLVQHTGLTSSMGNPTHAQAVSFCEGADIRQLMVK